MLDIIPIHQISRERLQEYWQSLYMYDRLKYRLGSEEDPTWTDVLEFIATCGNDMFYMELDGEIIGEFALDGRIDVYNFRQLHYSFRPGLQPKLVQRSAEYVVEQMLTWPGIGGIYGVLAQQNRAAIALAKRMGFQAVGLLIDGARIAGQKTTGVVYAKAGQHGRFAS